MIVVDKPWGHEEIWTQNIYYVGKVLVINPGHRLSRQYHVQKHESFYILSGHLTLEIGMGPDLKTVEMYAGDTYDCPPRLIHRMICNNDEQELVKVLEVSTSYLDDVVRLEDDYKRI